MRDTLELRSIEFRTLLPSQSLVSSHAALGLGAVGSTLRRAVPAAYRHLEAYDVPMHTTACRTERSIVSRADTLTSGMRCETHAECQQN